jgi:hypothetical protein
MRTIVEQSKSGNVTMEIETVFIVRGGKNKTTMQYHTPVEAVADFGIRLIEDGHFGEEEDD